jgi:signal transduction histidine kinase
VISPVQERLGFRRLVTVPMIDSAGNLAGTLGVYDPVVERDFGQTDVEALQLLAHQAAIAIENARLNQLKDEFLSIVSHELKTPVTSIKGFAQVLKRRLSPESLERSSRYLDVINHQADRLTALINDLLDLSRIQTGRFTFDLEPITYATLVQEVVAEMRLMSVHDRIDLASPERVTVHGNAERLRQVLVNLIDNAVKHGPQGGTVHVTVEERDGEVVTCVRDEGRGLPPGEAERIFRPYYQVRDQTGQQAKGLGLGLYISQRIVDEHHGRIWLEAAEHTSFCFTLPRA